jgi:short-subunit dehydrogenase
MKHVAIAGATDGIGLALAVEYARRGWRVGLLGRDPHRLEAAVASARAASPGDTVVGVQWDATDPADSGRAFAEVAHALGQVDLLVYVAGLLLDGESPDERAHAAARMMEVNATGAIRLLEHAADYMVAAGRGRLAAVGSIAGDRGRKGNPAYAASKAALDAYLEGLRHRLQGSGVGVSTVKPGFVRTRMLPDSTRAFPPAIAAPDAARRIVSGLLRERDVFYVPAWWALVSWAIRLTPRFLFKRIAPA